MSEKIESIKRGLANIADEHKANPVVRDLLWAVNEIERLQAVVDKLPKTADGVTMVEGMTVYCNGIVHYANGAKMRLSASKEKLCMTFQKGGDFHGLYYSTQAAAAASAEVEEARA